ncbi:DUF4249 domain-containing protein [Pontibacter akesuensis]|nr:DUF4249 domain-containing protein [Pontibacter akesuensis]
MRIRSLTSILCLCLLLFGCVEPYAPDVLQAPNQYLVVDGFINGTGVTTIKLSRTQNIADTKAPLLESGATLLLEEEQGEQYVMSEVDLGTYASDSLRLNLDKKYRIYIRTENGREYASEFVAIKRTPPIDGVGWDVVNEGLQIYVNTHDPQNDTRYYRWEYEATWAFTAAYEALYKYDPATGTVVLRGPEDEQTYRCWRTDYSTAIEIGTSTRLSEDVIFEEPILLLPSNSEKLRIKYSILVKQYALTREAYQYWESLKKNTESIGTLFDPLPSQLTGNVRNLSDAEEPVIGYVSASTMQDKRIFISREELPREWRPLQPYCQLDSVLPAPPDETFGDLARYFESGFYVPVNEIYGSSPFPIGYFGAALSCVDCRFRGTTRRPLFWQ